MRFLVADSEPAGARERRRASVGSSAGESFRTLLERLEPGVDIVLTAPADGQEAVLSPEQIAAFDGVFLTGSPLHIYDGSAESEREIAFMRAVFASGTPSFGSCAGLQVAVAAAGGVVASISGPREAGFARRIAPTEAGRTHPLLTGRPLAYDALTLHGDVVERLPDGATLLARNAVAIQAAEIRHDRGVFWGVQYHPELSLGEIAAALRRDADALVQDGLARTSSEVGAHADLLATLGRDPARADLAWRLGLDEQVIRDDLRRREIMNFIELLVRPVARERADRSGRMRLSVQAGA